MGNNNISIIKTLIIAIVFAMMFLAVTVGADPGLPGGYAKIKDWDQAHEAFSFSLGEVASESGDFFIAADRIHVFDSPGIIDMGNIPLVDIKEAPESGYQETAKPIEAHSYVIRSHGKYGKIHIEDIFTPEDYEWISVAEYDFEWVYQPDGMSCFAVGEAPSEPATQGQTGAGGEYECPRDAKQAYQRYMAAYNRLASLMAEGKGDTPEGQEAYQEFSKAKTCYDSQGQTGAGGEYECPQDAQQAYQKYISAYNKLTYLMAEGEAGTPEAQEAYKEYAAMKACYENKTSGIGPSPTPAITPTSTTPPITPTTTSTTTPIPKPNSTTMPASAPTSTPSSTDGEQQRLYPVADGDVYAYSYLNWNRANWGMYNTMGAGWHPVGGEKRAYLRFDLPLGLDISRAVLKLYQYHSAGPVHTLGVYRVTSPWEEGTDTYHSGEVEETAAPGELCWMQQPSFDPVPAATFTSAAAVPAWVEVNVTSLVGMWQGGAPNYGLVVKITNEHPTANDPDARSGFYTKEHLDQANRPVLELSLT
ncbi:MAG: DNRLRE domain-containing protein [Methanotrichaceae archaeon]|nr:DNRLRE domain-containing protein [Methanotrichaceae archaeon]